MTPAADEAAHRTASSAPALPARWADDPFLLDERHWWRPVHVRTAGDAMLLVQRAVPRSRTPRDARTRDDVAPRDDAARPGDVAPRDDAVTDVGGTAPEPAAPFHGPLPEVEPYDEPPSDDGASDDGASDGSAVPATMLLAVGAAEPVADLLRAHEHPGHRFAWVDTAALDLLRPQDVARWGLTPARTGWEWMVTDTPPAAVAAEAHVVELDPRADAAAIRACLRDANPSTDADPEGVGERWWGVLAHNGPGLAQAGIHAGPARLGGVIGAGPRAGRPGGHGSAHLHGLGVRPGERGRGLGAALTAAAVRALLAGGADWVSLGMWDDNHGARRIYHRLGLRTVHRLTTLRRS